MISGPTPPHPRVVLKGLLEGAVDGAPCAGASILEHGLEILEESLRVGDDLRVDFLGRDAAGVPVLVLAVDGEDEGWAPLRILDVDLWFRDNAFLFEEGLGRIDARHPRLRWSRGHRLFVVTLDVSKQFYQRLEAMTGLDLEVYELRSIFMRGETMWFLRGVSPWEGVQTAVPSAPEGLEDDELGELAETLLLRLANLSPDLELRGDRFSREVLIEGESMLELEVKDRGLLARVAGDEVRELRSPNDIDHVVDALLRVLLGRTESRARPEPMMADERALAPAKLTEEEMAAFLKT